MNLLSQELPEHFKKMTPRVIGLGLEIKEEPYTARVNRHKAKIIPPTPDQIKKILAMIKKRYKRKTIAEKTGLVISQIWYVSMKYHKKPATKWTTLRVPVTCKYCQTVKLFSPSEVRDGRKYCNNVCRSKDREKNKV
jgi:hypothetical protein